MQSNIQGSYLIQDTTPSMQRLEYQFPPTDFQFASPSVVGVPSDVAATAPIIVRMMVEHLVKIADSAPAQRYYFNLVASQGFRSDDWLRGVNFATLLGWMFFSTRQGANPQACQVEAARTVLIIKLAEAAAANQTLMNSIDQNARNEIIQLVNLGNAKRSELNRFLDDQTRRQQSNQQQINHGHQHNSAMLYDLSSNGIARTAPVGGPVGDVVDFSQPTKSVVRLDEDLMRAVVPRANIGPAAVANPYGDINLAADNTTSVVDDRPSTVMSFTDEGASVTEINTDPETVTESDWRPTPASPYRALSMGGSYRTAYMLNEGDVISYPEFQEQSMEREDMEIPSMNVAMQRALDRQHQGSAGEAVMTNLDLLVQGMRHVGEVEDVELARTLGAMGMSQKLSDDIGDVYSMNHAISMVRLARARQDTAQAVYTAQATLIDDIIIGGVESEVTTFAMAGNYQQLKEILTVMRDSADTPEKLIALNQVNTFITARYNDFIRERIGIEGYIDSFIDDIFDNLKDVEKYYGKLHIDAVMGNAREFLKTITEGVVEYDVAPEESDPAQKTNEGTEVPVEDKTPQAVALVRNITCTLIDVTESEMQMEITTGQTRLIFNSANPGMYAFVNAITESSPTTVNYLVTADNKLFKLSKSFVGEGLYVITKV